MAVGEPPAKSRRGQQPIRHGAAEIPGQPEIESVAEAGPPAGAAGFDLMEMFESLEGSLDHSLSKSPGRLVDDLLENERAPERTHLLLDPQDAPGSNAAWV